MNTISPPGPFRSGAHTSLRHDSADKHVTGAAIYLDDIATPPGTLHAALVLSPIAHGRLDALDTAAARAMPGVAAILTAADIPGENDIGAILRGEPLFAETEVTFAGQPIALVVATSLDAARAAAHAVRPAITPLPAILTIEEALAADALLCPPMVLSNGDIDAALAAAAHRITAGFQVGGQEHFYLEGQIALALPGEDGETVVHSSSQNPTEVQHICARLLGTDLNRVTAITRRMGGGFGGKESNASWVAGAAALAAHHTRRPVKLRLPREIDMITTGKRHGFRIDYTIGFDDSGHLLGLDARLAANGGNTMDHTAAVMTRALCHVENAYFIPAVRAVGLCCKTNTVSNTAFRGYGGPQAVVVMEDAILRIAARLRTTPEAIRALNFYGGPGRDTAPYGQKITHDLSATCMSQILEKSDFAARRAAIDAFNATSPVIRRGIASFPLKFGISFNKPQLNQAGALINIYSDGSIRLSHGGTEMGQGLFTKIAQVVAEVFQVDITRIALSATSTAEVPNTSPTAASTGSDLNGWAAHAAASTLRARMTTVAARYFDVAETAITFRDNQIIATGTNLAMTFSALAELCYQERVSLSSTGFYKTPDLSWDQKTLKGAPFFYFSYGAAVVEVGIDTLTGELRILRADLLQDAGNSLNPALDLGQVEGAFVQGAGWLTCEELWWDQQGRLRTAGPSTYKIPGSRDAPAIFNVHLLEDSPNTANTIFRSKGVGEPPLLLATAVWTAIRDALATPGQVVDLDAPATPERIAMAAQG